MLEKKTITDINGHPFNRLLIILVLICGSFKWLYLTAIFIFTIGTLTCALATQFHTILAGRLIQAVATGITVPLIQTIMLTIFPKNQRGSAMGLVGPVIGLAPGIGPTLTGYHSAFLVALLFSLAGIGIAACFKRQRA